MEKNIQFASCRINNGEISRFSYAPSGEVVVTKDKKHAQIINVAAIRHEQEER